MQGIERTRPISPGSQTLYLLGLASSYSAMEIFGMAATGGHFGASCGLALTPSIG